MSTLPVTHNWSTDTWDWPMQNNDGVVKVHNTDDHFEVGLDVAFFTPKEIEVKVAGEDLLVHCMHESRSDQFGSVKREIHRSYKLPRDVDAGSLKSHLNQKGVLMITADREQQRSEGEVEQEENPSY